jgi:branched-chain amino acid transport system permease protein
MTTRRAHSPLRYLPHRRAQIGVAVFVIAIFLVPLSIQDRFWLSIVATAGIYAMAATGLNVLTGYLGEASLGQAFFLAVGCFTGVAVGMKLELPLLAWAAAVLICGAVVGALVAPLSMRLSGPHLIVVTLGLVYLGIYLFNNWRSLSGGPGGLAIDLPLSVGGLDFSELTIGTTLYSAGQGVALLIWILVALCLWWVYNVSHSRRGREMRAIRDNPLAAQVAGVNLWRTRLVAFSMSGAIAALAGALYAQNVGYVEPAAFSLMLSIELVAVLIIGGSATTFGPVIGGIFVAAVPAVLDRYLGGVPFILGATEGGFGMTVPQVSGLVYALLLVLFLIFEPRGISAVLKRGATAVRHPATGSGR